VYTPEGLFEGSENAWKEVSFRFKGQTTNISPLEGYFEHYFDPGLLSSVLIGQFDPHPADPESMDRKAPIVTLTQLSTKQTTISVDPTSLDTSILIHTPVVHFRLNAEAGDAEGRVSNLKVYQNGLLVKDWRNRLSNRASRSAVQEFDLTMDVGANHIAAVAFNQDGIQSKEKTWDLPENSGLTMHPFSTLYVLAVGVSQYQNQRFNLDFPASDAAVFAKALDHPADDWAAQETRLLDWNQHRSILEGTMQFDLVPRHTVVKTLTDAQATKANILAAIREIVAKAKLQDIVILYFSGHGISADQHFYFLPQDSALQGDPQKAVPPLTIKKAAASLLADDDLEAALQDLNVAHAALIFDACQSGQAIAGSELRGPRLYPGLGRLAYEKGIYVLAASEESEPAAQLKNLKQSVLTYALVEEGMLSQAADVNPHDGTIDLHKWLSYAKARVPSLITETLKRSGPAPELTQHPQLSPRLIPEPSRLVLFVADKQP
jgi:uncharacterized caspase-like protein